MLTKVAVSKREDLKWKGTIFRRSDAKSHLNLLVAREFLEHGRRDGIGVGQRRRDPDKCIYIDQRIGWD